MHTRVSDPSIETIVPSNRSVREPGTEIHESTKSKMFLRAERRIKHIPFRAQSRSIFRKPRQVSAKFAAPTDPLTTHHINLILLHNRRKPPMYPIRPLNRLHRAWMIRRKMQVLIQQPIRLLESRKGGFRSPALRRRHDDACDVGPHEGGETEVDADVGLGVGVEGVLG